MPTIGVRVDTDLLVRLRKSLRLSQSEVARQLELHENYYQRVEAGKARISLGLLSTLETYYGLDPRLNELVHADERDQFCRTPALPS